jgi:hypothetical protein
MNMSELEWRRKHASISAGKKSAIAKQSHLLYVEINDLDGSSNHVPNINYNCVQGSRGGSLASSTEPSSTYACTEGGRVHPLG